MNVNEILLSANRKWLAARGVTDWRTMRRAIQAAQKKTIRQFIKFVAAFNEWEMLWSMGPDGTEIALNARLKEERKQIRKRISRIVNYIEGNCK